MGDNHQNSGDVQLNDSKDDDFLNDPSALASMQDLMDDARSRAIAQYRKLPQPIKQRIHALKRLQLDSLKVEQTFHKDVLALEAKMAADQKTINDRRKKIVDGDYEPTGEETEWASDFYSDNDDEDVEKVTKDMNKAAISQQNNGDTKEVVVNEYEDCKGIPRFWLTVFENVTMLNSAVQERDRPILEFLTDITCDMNIGNEPNFILSFHFLPNDHFTNAVLTKTYYLQIEIDKEEPFSFDGPEITRTVGCAINWKANKNVTTKIIKKVQKKKTGEKKTTMKSVKVDSFFNFFDPPTESLQASEELDNDTLSLLEADFEIGQFIKENIVPRAVLYFTGEAIEETDDELGEEMDEDEEDDSDDESSQPKEKTASKQIKQNRNNNAKEKEECKQQ